MVYATLSEVFIGQFYGLVDDYWLVDVYGLVDVVQLRSYYFTASFKWLIYAKLSYVHKNIYYSLSEASFHIIFSG